MEFKFDDYSAREVAQLLGVTKQCVEIWCRTLGLSPRPDPSLADSPRAARAPFGRAKSRGGGLTVTRHNSNSRNK